MGVKTTESAVKKCILVMQDYLTKRKSSLFTEKFLKKKQMSNLFELVGNTPLVELGGLCPQKPNVKIFAKLEMYNPTASVKARAAAHILQTAEKEGLLRAGSVILDASSGNTGIAYAALASAKGYKLKLCLPSNINKERKDLLRAYGVDCIYTSPLEGSDGAIRKARQLAAENPTWFYCDQYSNDANWKAHYEGTGPEIWQQTKQLITHFVSSLGTSGTFVGTSRYLKQVSNDRVKCYSVEPDSPFHGLEGMKHMETAIVPKIYDPTIADEALEAPTEESFALLRHVAKTQGLLIGPSCAAALYGALTIAQTISHGTIVVIFPDSGERYLSEPHLWKEDDEDSNFLQEYQLQR